MRAYRARQAQQRGLPLRRRGRPPRVTSDTESLQRQIVAKDREIAALQARNDELTRQIALLRETGVTQDSATDGNTGTGIVPESDGSTGQDGTGATGTVTDGNTVTGDGTQPDPTTPVLPGTPDTPVTPDGPDEPDDGDVDGDEDGDEDSDEDGGDEDSGDVDGDDDEDDENDGDEDGEGDEDEGGDENDGNDEDDGDGDEDDDEDDEGDEHDGDEDGEGDENEGGDENDGNDEDDGDGDEDDDEDDEGDEHDGDEDGNDDDDEDEGGSGGGIGSLRRQRDEAVAMVAELRALVEELRLQITVLQGRSEVLQTQLDRLLTLADAASPAGANPEAARANLLSAILRRFRRELRETEAQRDRLLNRLLAHGLNMEDATVHGHLDYGRAQTALYSQIERELHIRDRYAEWEETHRNRGAERRIDPLRPLAMQVLQTTIAVRWQFIATPPLGFRQRPRWEVEGVLLDPQSEQFLVEQSQDRIEYRLRTMGVTS